MIHDIAATLTACCLQISIFPASLHMVETSPHYAFTIVMRWSDHRRIQRREVVKVTLIDDSADDGKPGQHDTSKAAKAARAELGWK